MTTATATAAHAAINLHELRRHHETSWRRSYSEFIKIIRARGYKIGVEVGVAFGGHAEAILEQCEITRLYGVDPYQYRPDYIDAMNLPQAAFDQLFWYAMGRLSRFPNYLHIRDRSAGAATVAQGVFDFVYLDGDHSYAGVQEDLRVWAPRIRAGGIIGGHDYGEPQFPGVKLAVDDFCTMHKLQLHIEPRWVWWAQRAQAAATPQIN